MSEDIHKGERIAKRMARAGLCSRRDAERWIEQGLVRVNGKVIDSAALNVTERDDIRVDGKALPDKQETKLFLYHKPPGLVTSHKDEMGRETVFDHLPDFMPRVVSVGRLDLNTEGLLLLTNDGELSRFLELPETGWSRRYRVRVHGKVNEKRLASLKNGITVDGVRYKSIDVKVEELPEGEDMQKQGGTNTWLSVTLREGKNREIRRVMEALGLKVTRLIRTDYGPFALGKMTRGSVVEVKHGVLKQQVAKFFAGQGYKKVTAKTVSKKPESLAKKPYKASNSKKDVHGIKNSKHNQNTDKQTKKPFKNKKNQNKG